ncbi:MAG: hypothetical protein AABW48_03840 [Nanoarchaeota archaeon]
MAGNNWLILAIVFAGVLLVSLSLILLEFCSTINRLHRKLRRINSQLNKQSLDWLKSNYLDAYDLYLNLPEQKKISFYPNLTEIREKIESSIRCEKELEWYFHDVDEKDLPEQKKVYQNMYGLYLALPEKVQKKYYARVVQLREHLERGR